MTRILATALLLVSLALAGCTDRPAELFDTAQLEEKQENVEHARELYQRIVDQHPDSPQAQAARERLRALAER